MTPSRLHRVIGPPGTGKTSYLSKQVKIAAKKYGQHGVLVASLTRAAAVEVAGRDHGLAPEMIATLHSHAFHALGRPAMAQDPKRLAEWNAQAPSGYQVRVKQASGEDAFDFRAEPFDGIDPLEAVGVRRALMEPVDRWPGDLQRFHREWEAWKRQKNYLDFTDMIERAATDTECAPHGPAILMLDEAQDLSALEMRLASKWAEAADQLVIVGDPDQCLYEWRGSSPDVFRQGEAASERTLEQSYRVPKAVHALALGWIDATPGRPKVAYRPTEVEGSVRFCRALTSHPDLLVDAMEEAAADGREQMALATCGYMLAPLVAELRARGLPFHNPYKRQHGGWNPLANSTRVLSLLQSDPRVFGADARMWTWGDVWRWMEPMAAKHFVRGAKAWVEHTRIGADSYGQSLRDAPADAAWLVANMTEEAAGAIGAYDLEWWLDSLLASRRASAAYPVAIAKKFGAAKLLEEPKIIVGTVHSVKGGQADDVYVFPDLARPAMVNWEYGGERRAAVRRVFYVAFTRARQSLTICDGEGRFVAPLPRH